jgi:hypothetical protein
MVQHHRPRAPGTELMRTRSKQFQTDGQIDGGTHKWQRIEIVEI